MIRFIVLMYRFVRRVDWKVIYKKFGENLDAIAI